MVEEAKSAGANGRKNAHDFELERFKFLLQQIARLSERFDKNVAIFQGLATAVIGAGAAVFGFWGKAGISADAARTLIHGLLGLLVIQGTFVVISMIATVFSWRHYRREEARLLDEAVRLGYRRPPDWRNVWRWHETYLVVFLIVSVVAVVLFTEVQVIPLIN